MRRNTLYLISLPLRLLMCNAFLGAFEDSKKALKSSTVAAPSFCVMNTHEAVAL